MSHKVLRKMFDDNSSVGSCHGFALLDAMSTITFLRNSKKKEDKYRRALSDEAGDDASLTSLTTNDITPEGSYTDSRNKLTQSSMKYGVDYRMNQKLKAVKSDPLNLALNKDESRDDLCRESFFCNKNENYREKKQQHFLNPREHNEHYHRNDYDFNENETLSMLVTVPENMSAGQTLHVATSDERIAVVDIPQGVSSGSTFMVEVRKNEEYPKKKSANFDEAYAFCHAPLKEMRKENTIVTAYPKALYSSSSAVLKNGPTITQFRGTLNSEGNYDIYTSNRLAPIRTLKSNDTEDLLRRQIGVVLVHVPPGTPPGSTLFVEVPGKNQAVAVTVPPDTSKFHFVYKLTI